MGAKREHGLRCEREQTKGPVKGTALVQIEQRQGGILAALERNMGLYDTNPRNKPFLVLMDNFKGFLLE